jgi:hypothetical protein
MTGPRFVELGAPVAPDDEIVIGLARQPLATPEHRVAAQYDFVLTEARPSTPFEVQVADLGMAVERLASAITTSPLAAHTLCRLLRCEFSVEGGLVAESLAYSMLLAGPEFACWRATRPVRPIPAPDASPVLLERDGPVLLITLNRPERRNAYGVPVRDGLIEGLDLALADDSITRVLVRGNGPAFCSGGDLDEFGSTPDVVSAHLIRLDRSAALRIHTLGERLSVELHGACIGAGIELASFAGRVSAGSDTEIVLPELAMGLLPGAGGTVGIPRRIGRWRTAYLALTGAHLDGQTALDWGLVDELV